jgi:hypothetical protein
MLSLEAATRNPMSRTLELPDELYRELEKVAWSTAQKSREARLAEHPSVT